jgi:hypothetical protein
MSKRDQNIGVKATLAERRAWEAAARADGRTLSTWIARRCNGQPTTAPMFGPGELGDQAEPEPPRPKAPRAKRSKRQS